MWQKYGKAPPDSLWPQAVLTAFAPHLRVTSSHVGHMPPPHVLLCLLSGCENQKTAQCWISTMSSLSTLSSAPPAFFLHQVWLEIPEGALSRDSSTVEHNWSLERWEQMGTTEGHVNLILISFLLGSSSTGDPGSLQHPREVWHQNCSSPGWSVCPTDPVGLYFSKKNECSSFSEFLGKQSKTDLQKPH